MMSLLEHRTTASSLRLIATAFGLSLLELGALLPLMGSPWGNRAIATDVSLINAPALAQSLENLQAISFRPPTPPDVGSPRERRGAASRGGTRSPRESCPVMLGSPTITALVPAYYQDQSLVNEVPLPGVFEGNHKLYGSTMEPYPTLWLYLPYALTPNRVGELRAEVVGEDGVPVQQTLMTYTDAPAGVVGIPLAAADIEPLEIGEWRDLLFVLRCDRNDPAQNLTVGFTVQRVAPLAPQVSAPSELAAVQAGNVDLPLGAVEPSPTAETTAEVRPPAITSREQAVALAEAGIWYDLLTTLATLRRENPENPDFVNNWSNLLRSVGLADVADQALSDCCVAPTDAVADGEMSSE